jgi:nitrite reductase/ring-hydroxylating ferredoxin subunit
MKGWFQVAFERDVVAELTPAHVGDRRIVLVRGTDGIRAFDADCPHRGAHLAYGGRVCDGAIICPFHGYRVGLGSRVNSPFAVPEHATIGAGGMIFVRSSADRDNGWPEFAGDLARNFFTVNGFEMQVMAPAHLVVDNAFDQRHFGSVHGVRTASFAVTTSAEGGLVVEGSMLIPVRECGTIRLAPTPYRAQVFSPGLVAAELRGEGPYTVITGATPAPGGGTTVRITLAFPKSAWAAGPPEPLLRMLLEQSRSGLEADRSIWERVREPAQPNWVVGDNGSLQFAAFCMSHRDEG